MAPIGPPVPLPPPVQSAAGGGSLGVRGRQFIWGDASRLCHWSRSDRALFRSAPPRRTSQRAGAPLQMQAPLLARCLERAPRKWSRTQSQKTAPSTCESSRTSLGVEYLVSLATRICSFPRLYAQGLYASTFMTLREGWECIVHLRSTPA